jgi:hypothetical protein
MEDHTYPEIVNRLDGRKGGNSLLVCREFCSQMNLLARREHSALTYGHGNERAFYHSSRSSNY